MELSEVILAALGIDQNGVSVARIFKASKLATEDGWLTPDAMRELFPDDVSKHHGCSLTNAMLYMGCKSITPTPFDANRVTD